VIPTWTAPAGKRPRVRYSWGGFTIASDLALPRLWRTQSDADTWFRWRTGAAPPAGRLLRRDELRTRGGLLRVALLPGGIVRYQMEEVGLYVVRTEGRAIDFFPSPAADPMRVEHLLVNAVLPIYAGLRSEVCLHASAVAREGETTVFAGPSASGKSTKALEAIGRGGVLLGDDAAVIRRRGDAWLVYPGARTIRLDEPSPQGRSWRSGPKHEWFVASARDPVALTEVLVLDRDGDAAEAAFGGSGFLRALLSLQHGWVWGDVRARRALADQTAALCYPVTSRRPSLRLPRKPPVRSQTLPSGSSVGASYGSGHASSTELSSRVSLTRPASSTRRNV
jgi:hypothetical protein